MDSETFYGVTLTEKDKTAHFDVPEISSEYVVHSHKLIIKQISLGHEAKQGEFNVVEAETKINEKETIKIPIAVLKVGETRNLNPNIEFPNGSVTFKLIQGTGPVYVCGKSEVNLGEYEEEGPMYSFSDEEDEYSEDLDEDVPVQTNGKSNKKK